MGLSSPVQLDTGLIIFSEVLLAPFKVLDKNITAPPPVGDKKPELP